ncbi:ROK family protein [Hydrogenovibrio halophilus]|uniref:ROK family protein n=1 Tax=Hydrogenovibrio halophilus TaxID=373391 RepID=UPI00037B9824|nr:ROK family protein [Hydrogenovibrio halophilus]
MTQHWQLGIDLGGTKIEAALLSPAGDLHWQKRLATPQGDYDQTVATVATLVHQAREQISGPFSSSGFSQLGFSHVGVGIPGSVSALTGRIKNANSTCLIGQDLAADLQSVTGCPVRLANDANCFALSEASDGAARDVAVVFGVILGTGCGGGLVINGQIVNGANAIAGEWGHNPMPWLTPSEQHFDRPCYCGKTHCVETYLSGPGFSGWASHRLGRALTPPELVSLAGQGDEKAKTCLEAYAHWLARGLATVINVVDPDAIVLGGGLSQMRYLYERVPQIWSDYVFSDQVVTRLLPPRWGDASGVRGAAWL